MNWRDEGLDKERPCVTKKTALQALIVLDRRKAGVEEYGDQCQTRPSLPVLIAVDRKGKEVEEQDRSCTPRESDRENAVDGNLIKSRKNSHLVCLSSSSPTWPRSWLGE